MGFGGSKQHIRTVAAVAALATLGMWPVAGGAAPLRRDLGSYFIFASKFAHVKNLSIDNACNVGVNCAAPNSSSKCGELIFDDVTFADGSQAVGDRTFCTKSGVVLFDLFRNSGGPCNNITLNDPPIQPFNPTPIIAGTCAPGCLPDVAKLKQLCGFPDPFPACALGADVRAKEGEDCIGAPDTVPNNGHCDLAPGQYGDVKVQRSAQMNLVAGEYDVCSFKVARNATVLASGTTIAIAAPGSFRVGGQSKVGLKCGDLTVFQDGTSRVTLGRGVNIAAKVCAPGAAVKLGHGNNLIGQFVGDTVTANRDNHGQCCGGRCTCIDAFTPTTAHVGDVISLTGACDLSVATGVKICGIAAAPPFVSKTAGEIKVTVPVGASGACTIEVDSPQGSFVPNQKLTVN